VGLLDAPAPGLARSGPARDDLDLLLGVARDAAARAGLGFSISRAALEGVEEDERLRRVLEALHAGEAATDLDAAELRRRRDALRARAVSLSGYAPGPFSGTLTLFRPETAGDEREPFFSSLDGEEQRTLGWCRVSPRPVRVHPVPGASATLGSEPHVRTLARRIAESLAAARARHESADSAHHPMDRSST
jgi:thioesterase domain-containing protein